MTTYKAIKINGKKKDEHRYIMEQELGRKLTRDEVVHHEDENPRNNNVDNLKIMTRSEHFRLHGLKRGISDYARQKSRDANIGLISPARKLNAEDVAYIREHYISRDKEFGARALSRRFDIDHTTILDIVVSKAYTKF